MYFSILIFEIRSKCLLEAQSYLNVYYLFLMIVYISICWNIVLYVHLLIQLFEMSVSFHAGTVHYFQCFHCLFVVGSTHMTSIQFTSSTARHCVLWWLVIVLTDKWPYIILCYIFDLLHIDYLIFFLNGFPRTWDCTHVDYTPYTSCFNFQGSTFGEKHIGRPDRAGVLLHRENVERSVLIKILVQCWVVIITFQITERPM
jgi:hypothetical protein